MTTAVPNRRGLAYEVRELTDVPRGADGRVDLDAVHDRLAPADLLETADGSGWSYVVPHLGARVRDDGRTTRLTTAFGTHQRLGTDPLGALDAVAEQLGIDPHARADAALPPFHGGVIGAFAYELGHRIEVSTAPAHGSGIPAMDLRTADTVVAVTSTRDRVVTVARPSAFEAGTPRQRVTAIAGAIRRPSPVRRPATGARQHLTSTLPREAYLGAVHRILAAIGAGDVFQVNLARQLLGRWDGDVVALYRALRAVSPAPFGAALPTQGIASISPESFLAVDGGAVTTRPVKGTRRRDRDPSLDAALADDLATSAKDRAENVMVVDMERNDLGRISRPGSVRVTELTRVEAHPTVWHLVSTVRGRLRGDVGYGDLLRATFPCGSITGAPKVAAMRLISELEPTPRGWYCGAVGYLGDGRASLSVAIRTATLDGGVVRYGAGGGVVADSDPDAEHAESLDKAAAFIEAVTSTPTAAVQLR